MPAPTQLQAGEVERWEQAMYAFLAEKERRSGNTVEPTSRMPIRNGFWG